MKVVIQKKKIRKMYLLYVKAYKLSYEEERSLTVWSVQAHTEASLALRGRYDSPALLGRVLSSGSCSAPLPGGRVLLP